jgi:hypothetical protein
VIVYANRNAIDARDGEAPVEDLGNTHRKKG